MLQRIFNPWSLPPNLKFDPDGYILPFAFDNSSLSEDGCEGTNFEGELVLMLKEDEEKVYVLDFEQRSGSIDLGYVDQGAENFLNPWNWIIGEDDLNQL